MKVAIVHDYLKEFGGAERVLEALCEIFPSASVYTAFYQRESTAYRRFKGKKIITSWAQNVPFFASYLHSPLRFLAPLIWGGGFSAKGRPSFGWDFSGYDVVISSSSWYVTKGFGKGNRDIGKSGSREVARTIPDNLRTRKPDRPIEICYCHTPPRYLYGYSTSFDWQKYWPVKVYALLVNHFMRVYDYEAAQRVDYFIANSKEVQTRIKKFYRRDSTVIYPPVALSAFSESKRIASIRTKSLNPNLLDANSYFLVVSRLVASKKVDIVVEVCSKLKLPLKVVGAGRELQALKELAEQLTINNSQVTVEFMGEVTDEELVGLYQNCKAVIFPAQEEDFGLVPVEAMAAGKPVIANAQGGVLETVIDAIPAGKGKGTGVYFDPPTAGSLTLAINNFIDLEKKGYFDSNSIKNHAEKFSKDRFKREILKFVKSKTPKK